MRDEDLKIIWICKDCKDKFVFISDVDDHKMKYNHINILRFDMESGVVR